MLEDVTLRKYTLREARAEQQRKRAGGAQARRRDDLERAARDWILTFDALAIGIVVLDAAGRVMRINRAALELACAAEYRQVVGRLAAEVSHREPWRSCAELVRRVREDGRAAAELRDTATGKTWFVTLGRMGRAGDGEERLLLTARDLTEIVTLQQALGLSQSMAAMGSLVAGVAHEVRNPLFCISASLDALERRLGFDEQTRPYAAGLRRSVQRLSELMGELLEYGRPRGSQLLPGSLHDVLQEAIECCQAQARAAGVTLSDRTAPGLPPVAMDRGRLALVFRNLVENALHHSAAGATVILEAASAPDACGRAVECLVRDRGPGFREEDLSRIFEPFFTRRRGGTGLGLSIAQRIVQQHGGSISAFNHPEGGAVVAVRLPCAGRAVDSRPAL
jgi:PAS domain S-box-containing protein